MWSPLLMLAVLSSHSIRRLTASRLPNIYWNSTNPLFSDDVLLTVTLRDSMNLLCPSYPADTLETDTEQSVIYRVSRAAYDSCQIDPKARSIGRCADPYDKVEITHIFRKFSPVPGGLEYRVDNEYYFITTSSGKANGIEDKYGGLCMSANMRLRVKVMSHETLAAADKLKQHAAITLRQQQQQPEKPIEDPSPVIVTENDRPVFVEQLTSTTKNTLFAAPPSTTVSPKFSQLLNYIESSSSEVKPQKSADPSPDSNTEGDSSSFDWWMPADSPSLDSILIEESSESEVSHGVTTSPPLILDNRLPPPRPVHPVTLEHSRYFGPDESSRVRDSYNVVDEDGDYPVMMDDQGRPMYRVNEVFDPADYSLTEQQSQWHTSSSQRSSSSSRLGLWLSLCCALLCALVRTSL